MYLLTFTEITNRICLEEKLKKKAKNYELVIYSVLPIQIIDKVLEKLDFVKKYVSHVLGYEHCLIYDKLIIKDLMLLKEGRTQLKVDN